MKSISVENIGQSDQIIRLLDLSGDLLSKSTNSTEITMGYMNIIDPTGHTKHIWDASSDVEVEAARSLFTSLTARGYSAFDVSEEGKQTTRMREFNPSAEKMILTPQLRGG